MKQINSQKIQNKLRNKFIKSGVKMIGPETIFFSEDTKIGKNVIIEPYVVIGKKVKIGNNVRIHSFCHLEDSKIENNVNLGPYARLRPGTVLQEGAKLPSPYLEVSTKFEKFDRLLDRTEALEISNLTEDEFDTILGIVVKVDEIIQREVSKSGLIHVDGKKEFALGKNRVPVLVDSFGTLDEDRWWDAEKYAEENGIEYWDN